MFTLRDLGDEKEAAKETEREQQEKWQGKQGVWFQEAMRKSLEKVCGQLCQILLSEEIREGLGVEDNIRQQDFENPHQALLKYLGQDLKNNKGIKPQPNDVGKI